MTKRNQSKEWLELLDMPKAVIKYFGHWTKQELIDILSMEDMKYCFFPEYEKKRLMYHIDKHRKNNYPNKINNNYFCTPIKKTDEPFIVPGLCAV